MSLAGMDSGNTDEFGGCKSSGAQIPAPLLDTKELVELHSLVPASRKEGEKVKSGKGLQGPHFPSLLTSHDLTHGHTQLHRRVGKYNLYPQLKPGDSWFLP